MEYLLFTPREYGTQSSWPLLLFLHGSGECGDNLELVKQHGPPKLIAAGKDFPFIVVSPQLPTDKWWEPIELLTLIDKICSMYPVDSSRIYVTGISLGGFGTWALAAYASQRLAAIVPICGGGETLWAERIKDLPVWAFHGAHDTIVPLERSQAMIEALEKVGGTPKLTIYPEAGHDSWTVTYDNPALYEWLMAQKRMRTS